MTPTVHCCLFWRRALVEGGGRVSARRPRYLFFASPKKSTPKKGDPAARVPLAGGEGAACDARSWGDAEELPALPLRGSSGQTASASQMTMRVSFGTRSPQALRFSARSEGGGSGLHTGHCFARPVVLRCARLARAAAPSVGSAQREPTPGAAAQAAAEWYPLPTPAGCAEKRRAWGGCVCRRTHALRDLACRSCLNGVRPKGERSEFCGTTPGPSIAGCPHSPGRANGGRRLGAAFSLVTFSWRPRESYCAAGRTPRPPPSTKARSNHERTTQRRPRPTPQLAFHC